MKKVAQVVVLLAVCSFLISCVGPTGPQGDPGRQGIQGQKGPKGEQGDSGILCTFAVHFQFDMQKTRNPIDAKLYNERLKFTGGKEWVAVDFPDGCFPRDKTSTYGFPTVKVSVYLTTPTGKGRIHKSGDDDFLAVEIIPRDKADKADCCFQSEAPHAYLSAFSAPSVAISSFGFMAPRDIQALYQMNQKSTKLALRTTWFFENKENLGYTYQGTIQVTFINRTETP